MKRSRSKETMEETKSKRQKTIDIQEKNMLEKWFPHKIKMPEGNDVYSFEGKDKKQIVKIFPKLTRADMAKREIKILQTIESQCDPYFLCSSEIKQDAENYYIVTEFLTGFTDLFDLFIAIGTENITLSEQEYTRLFCSLIQGLLKLHKLGVSHRDVKPGNIMIKKMLDENKDRWFLIKYIDFGQSCLAGECDVALGGTKMYKPPEYYRNEIPDFDLARKEDYWALGMTFLDLLLGRLYHREWFLKHRLENETEKEAIRRNVLKMKGAVNFMEFMPKDFPEKMPKIFNLLVNMLQVDPEERDIPITFISGCFQEKKEKELENITPTPEKQDENV